MPHVALAQLRRSIDASASQHENKLIRTKARVLIQQYIALRALLYSCDVLPPCAPTPFPGLHNIVQLDETHSNARSIMIFKAVWLVVAEAEKLWDSILQHGGEGRINPWWTNSKKAGLRRELEIVTEIAVTTLVDGAREGMRYRAVVESGGQRRYW